MPENEPFGIGLVMAGAISAGAYTAGVVDFLVEALDTWEAAKAAGEPVPRHRVSLAALSGASAGAITSAIAAAFVNCETEPVHDVDNPPAPGKNRLYDAWVRQIDMGRLLTSRDMGPDQPLRSVLDSTVLDEIASDALRMTPLPDARRRPWVADPLEVFLTVTNLRGVPYGFNIFGAGRPTLYGMTAHKDYVEFSVGRVAPEWSRRLDPAALRPEGRPQDDWATLGMAALASAAFPVGLRSRPLRRPFGDYGHRPNGAPSVSDPPDPYQFLCVDGGAMDNEPLELCRQYLAQDEPPVPGLAGSAAKRHNPRGGVEARRAVIMVDPFPNTVALATDGSEGSNIVADLRALFAALMSQARFKEEELQLAANKQVFSRFQIIPSRSHDGKEAVPAMASAILGGFGGFLSEAFRRHDFQLGRRNCQRFLTNHLVLPQANPLLLLGGDPVDADLVERWCVRDRRTGEPIPFAGDKNQRMMPVIPVVGNLTREEQPYRLPKAADVDMVRLQNQIASRSAAFADKLFDTQIAPLLGGGMVASIAKPLVNWRLRPQLEKRALDAIAEALSELPAE